MDDEPWRNAVIDLDKRVQRVCGSTWSLQNCIAERDVVGSRWKQTKISGTQCALATCRNDIARKGVTDEGAVRTWAGGERIEDWETVIARNRLEAFSQWAGL